MVWQILGGLSGASSIALGAYGAHSLKAPRTPTPPASSSAASKEQLDNTSPLSVNEIWSRAVHYQQIHSVGLILVPLVTAPGSMLATAAGSLFTTGIVLFSGGLYATALTGDRKVSKGAPFGGMAFILGWIALAAARRPPPIR